MNQKVRLKLIEVAKSKKLITYHDLSNACNLGIEVNNQKGGLDIGNILGEIMEYENSQNRPLLSVVAVREDSKVPGNGFYTLSEKLGFGKASKLQNDIEFISNQTNLCHDFWKDEANYEKFK